jgi:cell division protease FtsH
MPWVIIGLIVVGFLVWRAAPPSSTSTTKVDYGDFRALVAQDHVASIKYDASSGKITGQFREPFTRDGKKEFTTQGQINQLPDADIALLNQHNVARNYKPRSSDILGTLLVYLLPLVLIGGIWFFIARRAQGQMGAVMNIGRSRAKVYNTDKPKTTFADVAGYGAVKEEITEVVGFLKQPAKFKEIGARIPKGVLLVGPPGTGKTLIARVGAARVRDLFQTAKKQAPAIIFVDEIDSIGRKRGAGLGGGHDEREQTLNQMLAEMDGFEATEGIVMMAATNRPDILDPALLRPGRFDRQIMVPLPTLDERVEILKVHMRDKKMDPDVDVGVVARGTPGMSGADLSNLVNEAALFAVRRGANEVHREDFDAARDRVLMGLKRESLALSEEEKEIIAYHEGGHAVCAYVLEHADPLHKVTILPTGMALGVTHQLPTEERHIYKREYIADSLVVRLGGRVSEELIFGHQSTGAQNDLVGNTELARKMVREWGMSDRIGPMAWGSQGAVFLGEDLMHSRDYSDETARVIDEEVERILRDEEDRCRKVLTEYRAGLDGVAKALLERETLSGVEVETIVDQAMGRKVGGPRLITRADGTEVPADPSLSPEDGLLGDLDTGASIATDTPLDPR